MGKLFAQAVFRWVYWGGWFGGSLLSLELCYNFLSVLPQFALMFAQIFWGNPNGAHKRGFKPQNFRENGKNLILPGKSGLLGLNGVVTGKSLDSPRKWNVDKMSEKYLKNVQKLSGGAENTIFGHFLDSFCLFGQRFGLVTLSNARPLQEWGLSGPLRALSGTIGTNSSAPHSHKGRAKVAPKGHFLAQLAPFGPSPRLLS